MYILLMLFSLMTTQVQAQPEPDEVPADYSASELRDRARTLSFNTREEYENVINAKLTMRAQYLNLFPHISIVPFVILAAPAGFLALIATVGDIVPFLLASRWFNARESKHLYLAERYASELMQLNAMQVVEGLAIATGRDIEIDRQMNDNVQLIATIEREVSELEAHQRLPEGSSLGIATSRNALEQSISSLESVIEMEKTQLAHAAGFTNPQAIRKLQVDPLGDIDHPPVHNREELEGFVENQSLEIKQTDELILAARSQRRARYFQWLDPAGDRQGGLGPSYPDFVEIGTHNVHELEVTREEVASKIYKRIADVYSNYQGWIDSYQLADEGVKLQEKRITIARQHMQNPVPPYSLDFGVQELREAVDMIAVNHVSRINALYTWYATISLINRLTRQGAYGYIQDPEDQPDGPLTNALR